MMPPGQHRLMSRRIRWLYEERAAICPRFQTAFRTIGHLFGVRLMRIRQAMIVVALICSHGRIGSGSAGGSKGTVSTQPPRGDLFSISSGPVDNPDIVWSPRIPVVGREVTLLARVRGRGEHPVGGRFLFGVAGKEKVVLSGKILPAQADKTVKYADYQAKWKPTEPGIYGFTVQVDPANRLGDPFIKNNTASVTLPVTWRQWHASE